MRCVENGLIFGDETTINCIHGHGAAEGPAKPCWECEEILRREEREDMLRNTLADLSASVQSLKRLLEGVRY